ncbi:putative C2H2 zinc finger domain protein [Aspergillus homomorphus CBS 101889]|uniref:C2H2-type domain-containing protein n=1 Tax=Aspergillus homomorphus (strain CBS 101889) TaxID=1450537 RepID=A0A395HWM4_ASPHC|nr:hypothetical protein BO97DRAFT_426390 [Aspergillus homomorphus CBS 101889]RAL10624.1 hypothetical protein BO97DRAFT_426390 [Aspergillus homomorphus CBS 101889]
MNDDPSNNAWSMPFTYPNDQTQADHGHLMPTGAYGVSSSQPSPSSIPSLESPAISISPSEDILPPDFGIPLFPEPPTNLLAGVQAPFNSEIPLAATANYDTATDPLYLAPNVQPSNEIYPDQLKHAVDNLMNTVQSVVLQRRVPQLHDAKDFLRVSWNRLDGMIQQQIDISERLAEPGSRINKYLCLLCPSGQRKQFTTRASFRRHVSYEHCPRFIYRCLDDHCAWKTSRKDKVHSHLRIAHGFRWRATREQINIIETRMRPPRACGLCSRPVDSWEGYFKCVSEHCRLSGSSSTSTSASQSRRNSDDRGRGSGGPGHGPNEFQFPGSGFGANDGHASSASGNGSMGSSFFGSGYHNNQYADGATHGVSSSELATHMQSPSNSDLIAELESPDPLSAEEPLSGGNFCAKRTSLTNQHRSMIEAMGSTNCRQRHMVDSISNIRERPPNTSAPRQPVVRGGLADAAQSKLPDGQEELPRDRDEGALEKKCNTCGHVFDSCTQCRHSDTLTGKCHQCAHRARVKAGVLDMQTCRNTGRAFSETNQDVSAFAIRNATLSLSSTRDEPNQAISPSSSHGRYLPGGASSVFHVSIVSLDHTTAKPDDKSHKHRSSRPRLSLITKILLDTNQALSAKGISHEAHAIDVHTQRRCLPMKLHEPPMLETATVGRGMADITIRKEEPDLSDDREATCDDSYICTPREMTLPIYHMSSHATLRVMFSSLSGILTHQREPKQGTSIESLTLEVTDCSRSWLCEPPLQETRLPRLTKERGTRKKGTTMLRARLHIVVELLALHAMAIKRRSQRKCLVHDAHESEVFDCSTPDTFPELASSVDVVSPLFDAVIALDTFAMVNIVSSWITTVVPETDIEGQVELMMIMWSYIFMILESSPIALRLQS